MNEFWLDLAFLVGTGAIVWGCNDIWGAGIAAIVCGSILTTFSLIGSYRRDS